MTFTPRTRRTRRTLLGATALASAVLLAGCAGSNASADGDGGGDEIVLGFTATMTGDFASYGIQLKEGVEFAVAEINEAGGIDGKQVRVVSADDEGKPANGPVVAQQFCDDSSISAVLGYSFSSVALSALPVYDQCGLPVVASAVTSPELSGASPVFFRNIFTDSFQGAEMGAFVAEHEGAKKIAVLHQQDDYGQGIAAAFSEAFEEAGGEVTSTQAYQLGTVSFTTLIDTALRDDVDGIFVGGFYTETSKIASQLREAGSDVQLYAADGTVHPDFLELGGDAVEGTIVYTGFAAVAAPDSPFVTDFTEASGAEPGTWTALAYDAVQVVAKAIEDAGSADREAIVSALAALEPFDGVTGPTSFDENGDRAGELFYLQVVDGRFTLIED
ncbi:ABC transporter substrate-binding protein [Agromyces silvae]|uniref:ABC transporter substrate-binding protein n=1 Tax=Agromyces silvae TaxID=3388266 RepID=UPI00280B280B|nr:penicillin-binding protein activator [Agromyces protaetiae]